MFSDGFPRITCGFSKTGFSHVIISNGLPKITCGFSKTGFSHVILPNGIPEITCGISKTEFSHVIFPNGLPEITCGFSITAISHVITCSGPGGPASSLARYIRTEMGLPSGVRSNRYMLPGGAQWGALEEKENAEIYSSGFLFYNVENRNGVYEDET